MLVKINCATEKSFMLIEIHSAKFMLDEYVKRYNELYEADEFTGSLLDYFDSEGLEYRNLLEDIDVTYEI